jgi:phage replication O-like protein O
MELIAKTPLTERETRVVAAIARKTLGWKGKSAGDRLAASQLAKLTGIGRSHVTETLALLEARGVITRRDGCNGRAATIALYLAGAWSREPVPTQGQVNGQTCPGTGTETCPSVGTHKG